MSVSIAPAAVSYITYRGTTFRTTFTWQSEDLRDYDVLLQCRTDDDAKTLAFELGTIVGGIDVDPGSGVGTIEMSPAGTLAVAAGQYLYDLLVQHKTNGDIFPLLRGTWTFYTPATLRAPSEEL